MDNETKTFDWSDLPPGEYKYEGNELFRISVAADLDTAAANFIATLRRLPM
jgi:hypothetical protein